ncbi:hypothetical protein Bbelb_056870 [Branchiostoma belcheri]|nr:hypothetical protein Bbelb_056870 [Branchiostoma belcheri]
MDDRGSADPEPGNKTESPRDHYYKPDDIYKSDDTADAYKGSEDKSFGHRAKERALGMWKKWKSSPDYWMAVSSGLFTIGVLLLISAAVLASNQQPGGKDAKFGMMFKVKLNKSDDSWFMAPYKENHMAVIYSSTPSSPPGVQSTEPLTTTQSLTTTVVSMSTTDNTRDSVSSGSYAAESLWRPPSLLRDGCNALM